MERMGWRIDGEVGWIESRSITFETAGTHSVRWVYRKDDGDASGEDCAWVDGVMWTPSGEAEVLPTLAMDAEPLAVTNAIEAAGFADAGVMAAIGGRAEKYAAFKTWAGSVKNPGGSPSLATAAGEAAVVANTNAAMAFLLGAERLFENLPVIEIGEVVVDATDGTSVVPVSATGETPVVPVTLTVSVIVKDGEVPVNCAAEKVKEMFEAVSDLGDWANGGRDGARPSLLPVSVEVVEGDTETSSTSQLPTSSPSPMRFKVTPGDGTAPRAFLRVRVK